MLDRYFNRRKHQIRVHAQSIGCPLVGEKLYGKDESIYLDFCTGGWREEWKKYLVCTGRHFMGDASLI